MIDSAARTPDRDNNFDFLRFLLALLVIWEHAFAFTIGRDFEPIGRLTGGRLHAGELGVDGFFSISGYLVAASWSRSRSLAEYAARRAKRIVPGFVVAAAFTAFVAAPLCSSDRPAYWRAFSPSRVFIGAATLEGVVAPAVLATNARPDGLVLNEFNGSLWTVRCEAWCYAGIAALGAVGLLRCRVVLPLLLGAMALLAVNAMTGKDSVAFLLSRLSRALHADLGPAFRLTFNYSTQWPRLASHFLAGMLFRLLGDRVRYSGWPLAVAMLTLAAATPRLRLLPLAMPAAGAYLVFAAAFWPGPLRRFGRHGDISYGLYLYAFPIQRILVRHCSFAERPIGLFLASTAATLIPAILSWRLVERPFLRRRH